MSQISPHLCTEFAGLLVASTLAMHGAALAESATDAPTRTAAASTSAEVNAEFDKVLQPFLTEHCARCHNEKKQKGEFRVDNLSRDLVSGHSANKWAEVVDRISSGEMPPEDEPQPKPEEVARLVEWISAKLKEGETARLATKERVIFNKLTRAEYSNTVEDLLGVKFDATDPTGLSEDELWHGFERIGTVLSLSPAHVEKYFAAAETVLAEALPAKPPQKFSKHWDAIYLRGLEREELTAQGVADKVRADLWPGADLGGSRVGPGQWLTVSGDYKVRIQLSGLKPKDGPAPHLAFYAIELDRMLFEKDIVTTEDKPVIVEFTTHLPAGNVNYRLSNDVPGPSNLPRSGRADPRIPFLSIKDGRRPWQMKITDEEGQPLVPFLIVDWVEWEGPIMPDGPTYAQQHYMPKEAGNFDQVREVLTRFVERAFRRPAAKEEVEQFVKLVQAEVKAGEPFDAAMKTGLLAVLCSKDFLYLVEGSHENRDGKIDDWELASRLSYFLWSTMPDEELFGLARNGTLHQPEVLRAQVKRMLADARAVRFSESFASDWLQLQQVGMFPPDKKLYPDYDAYLEKSMVGETKAFFREVLEKNLSIREFLDSNWTIVNARLAAHYGLPIVNDDRFTKVALRPEDNRGGLLTQASILSLTSDGTRHRPVHRGKWVLESIFGKPPPPPPANVSTIEPTPATGKKVTLRMKLAAHISDPNCASCHKKIDPMGIAFDNYDAIGRFRMEEVVSDGMGDNPKVDASGEMADGRKFANVAGLKAILVEDIDKFNTAFIEKLSTYALRRVMTLDDRKELAELAKKSKAQDYRLGTIVEELVLSELFKKR